MEYIFYARYTALLDFFKLQRRDSKSLTFPGKLILIRALLYSRVESKIGCYSSETLRASLNRFTFSVHTTQID